MLNDFIYFNICLSIILYSIETNRGSPLMSTGSLNGWQFSSQIHTQERFTARRRSEEAVMRRFIKSVPRFLLKWNLMIHLRMLICGDRCRLKISGALVNIFLRLRGIAACGREITQEKTVKNLTVSPHLLSKQKANEVENHRNKRRKLSWAKIWKYRNKSMNWKKNSELRQTLF